MSKKISGAEFPLSKIFSSDFEYLIPSYQRPYAWQTYHVAELFADLYDFYKTEPDEGYFLGSIVLIKQEGSPIAEVIDGQQRLTTLTILLAAIASEMNGEERNTLMKYIKEPGNSFEKLEAKPRLTIRERDNEFFNKYVQSLDFDGLLGLDLQTLNSEAQKNIYKNSDRLLWLLKDKFRDDSDGLVQFVGFVLRRCFLVAVSTSNEQSAFRVFSVMNSRGLDLQATDIIKAGIIGKIENQDEYNERWENMEVELGREGFNDLFTYIRMIYAKEKAKRAILEEFRTHVLSEITSPESLIENVLEPYSDALATIKYTNYEASSNAQDINGYLRWLNRIDNSDWLPPAIQFLAKHKHNPEYVLWFFRKLERLAAYMHVCAKNINERIARYAELVKGLEGEHNLEKPVSEVELRESEKLSMKLALDGNIYELAARRRNYVILRLDSFLSDGAATYDHSVLTIEHVLPQTVNPETEWESIWPDVEERHAWIHRISNLVPLNKRRNSQAKNYDFYKKKTAYFAGNNNVSSYALTTQVLTEPEWTPDVLKKRQGELHSIMMENWELGE